MCFYTDVAMVNVFQSRGHVMMMMTVVTTPTNLLSMSIVVSYVLKPIVSSVIRTCLKSKSEFESLKLYILC